MRRTGVIVLCLLAAGAIAWAVAQGSSPEPKNAARASDKSALAGSPAPLAALHEQANTFLDGGAPAFKAELRKLRGYPVVVNKWAAWCGPCRFEFPFLQRQAVERGKKVAFLGVNSNDNDAAAKDFVSKFPVTYPHFRDPKLAVAAVFNGVQAFPTTAFYDSKGKLAYVHQGAYASERKLAADIERYAR
ncbi:MAG TPA: TlpA disulfide reductase family protein [Thermoleophilaceae bacterium]|jgi:thiol-disulfide isomerase/thioredoxin